MQSRELDTADSSVDAAIDVTVASMTSGSPEPGLGDRVAAALEGERSREQGRRWTWPPTRLAAIAAGASCLALVALWLTRTGGLQPPLARDEAVVVSRASGTSDPVRSAGPLAGTPLQPQPADAGVAHRPSPMPAPTPASTGRAEPVVPRRLQATPLLDPVVIEPLEASVAPTVEVLPRVLEPVLPAAIVIDPLVVEPLVERLAWPAVEEDPRLRMDR